MRPKKECEKEERIICHKTNQLIVVFMNDEANDAAETPDRDDMDSARNSSINCRALFICISCELCFTIHLSLLFILIGNSL